MTIRYSVQLLAPATLAIIMATARISAQTDSGNEVRFQEAMQKAQVEGDLTAAIKIYQTIASDKSNRSLAAKALMQLGRCYEKQGNTEARKAYERVLREFADQTRPAEEARTRLAKMNTSRPQTEVVARKLTQSLGTFALRTVSRDGRYTAYSFPRRNVIMLLDLTTGKERELGGGHALIAPGDLSTSAAVSPDGTAVAYNRSHVADGTSDLCIIGVNATQPAVLQRGLKGFYITDWSRDGSSILIRQFPVDIGPQRSLLVDARTGQLKELPFQGQGAIPVLASQMRYAQERLSPDGKFLADTFIESPGSRKTGVVVTAVDVDKPYKIAGAPADAYVFGWSPDGGQLLYVSDQSGSYDLWTVAVKEGRPIGVPSVLKKDFGLAQASGVADNGGLYYSLTGSVGNLYVGELDTDSAAIRRLEQVPQPRGHLSVHATWSPDGKRLLIDRRSDEFATTGFIRDMATGEERQAKLPEAGSSARTRADGTFVSPYESRWSADGKSFVFLISLKTDFETRSSTSRVSVANVDTGDVTSQIDLPVSRSMYSFPTVAPDSRHLYTAKGDLNGSGVVRIDLQTGEEKQVCVARGMAWALSPDGSQIACAGFGNTIQILPAQGGPVRDLVKGDEFGPMTWTADGKHLIYTTLTPSAASGGSGHYWIVPVTGGTPRGLDIGLGSAGSMSVHPDNRHIAISPEGMVATELWVLENVVRSSK